MKSLISLIKKKIDFYFAKNSYETLLTLKKIFDNVEEYKKGKEQQRLKGRCGELMVGANQDITVMKMGWELLS